MKVSKHIRNSLYHYHCQHTLHVHICLRPQTSCTIGAADQSVHRTLPCPHSLGEYAPHIYRATDVLNMSLFTSEGNIAGLKSSSFLATP